MGPEQNGRHFWDDIITCIFFKDKFEFQLKFPKCAIDDKSTSVQLTAWRRTGDKLLHEPMMTKFYDTIWSH